jgi:L-Ala-D/L-Glu epimerase
MQLSTTTLKLHPKTPFRISREAQTEVQNVIIELTADGVSGYGEASPNKFYKETADRVVGLIEGLREYFAGLKVETVADIERVWHEVWPKLQPSRAAQCAVDIALWDWLAKKKGISVCELALGRKPAPVVTSFTIGISTPEELVRKVEELKTVPSIKVKSDAKADLAPLRYIAANTVAKLRVDANCAWGELDAHALSTELTKLRTEFIEQPLPPELRDQMPQFLKQSVLPVLADESCVVRDDVERVPGHFHGFNIKLVKCGGITPGLAMARRGKELGLKMMVGCMLETNLLIAAGLVVAQETDFADLDGSWLLADDPFRGLTYDNGTINVAGKLGLGVEAEI